MFVIDPNTRKIILTKGDTASIYIQVVDLDGNACTIQSTDTVTLSVRQTTGSTVVLSKTADSSHYIVFYGSDTSSLSNGLYVYDVDLVTADGYKYTIVPESFFEIRGAI